jgi:hypothetical protein
MKKVGKTGLLSVILPPPSYPRNPVPTSSVPFCFFVRLGKQAFPAAENTKPAAFAAGFLSVGKTGFEPATPWSQTRCATGLRYFPNMYLSRFYRRANFHQPQTGRKCTDLPPSVQNKPIFIYYSFKEFPKQTQKHLFPGKRPSQPIGPPQPIGSSLTKGKQASPG